MGEIMTKIFELMFGENKEKRNKGIIQFKSFVLLSLILALFSNIFWDMKGCISSIICKEVQVWILDISKITAHIFTSLVIISFVIFVVSAIVFEILDKKSNNIDRIDYFHRLRIGSSSRFSNSLEDVLIFLMIGYFFDSNFISDYTSVYSKYLWIGIFIACAVEFIFSSSIGIINRFFVFWSPNDMRDKE